MVANNRNRRFFHGKGVYRGGKGAVPLPRPVKGEPALKLRAITLFKSETKE